MKSVISKLLVTVGLSFSLLGNSVALELPKKLGDKAAEVKKEAEKAPTMAVEKTNEAALKAKEEIKSDVKGVAADPKKEPLKAVIEKAKKKRMKAKSDLKNTPGSETSKAKDAVKGMSQEAVKQAQ